MVPTETRQKVTQFEFPIVCKQSLATKRGLNAEFVFI